jgi:hypothetical protein
MKVGTCAVTLDELDTDSVTGDVSVEELDTAYTFDEEGEATTMDVFEDEGVG